MSVTPQQIAKEARLCRQSGHHIQSAKLLQIGKNHYPTEPCLVDEERRLIAEKKRPLRGIRRVLTAAVDLLGTPVFVAWSVLVTYILLDLLFVPAG